MMNLNIKAMTIIEVNIKEYSSYKECYNDMMKQGCKDLGWLNGGAKIPKEGIFVTAYCNPSGTSCLMVDITKRMFYSVDMGD